MDKKAQYIWEMDEPVVRNADDLKKLNMFLDHLGGKKITIQGMDITEDMRGYIPKLFYGGKVKSLCFSNCHLVDVTAFSNSDCLNVIFDNCNLSAQDAKIILVYLSPNGPSDVEFSHNNFGGEGSRDFLDYLIRVITEGMASFRKLKLSNNGFSPEDIEYFKDAIKSENHSVEIYE